MKKLVAEQNLKRQRLSGLFMVILIILVAFLSVARVAIANRLVESSEKLRTLDLAISKIQDQNQVLAQSVRGPQSLTKIEVEAKQQGFIKASNLVFVSESPTVAMQTDKTELVR